ncbi:DUF4870 domain-containing protein [Streptomyces monticola]|uniref:DUF4870 domain-containing protein n=1 Tax=Streptomyces monticola TaxID=2666263 RepID=A0ABW2JVN6_9ACTN
MTTSTPTTTGVSTEPAAVRAMPTTGALFSHLSHVLCLITGFPYLAWIPALCIKVSAKDEHTRSHATTALNFVLTQLMVWLAGFAAWLALTVLSAGTADWAVVAVLVTAGVAALAYLALGAAYSIAGMVKAGRLEPFRYPKYLAFPIVK